MCSPPPTPSWFSAGAYHARSVSPRASKPPRTTSRRTAVASPAINVALAGEREGEVAAGGDAHHVVGREELDGLGHLARERLAVAQAAVLAVAPGPDLAVRRERHRVELAALDRRDRHPLVHERAQQPRRRLVLAAGVSEPAGTLHGRPAPAPRVHLAVAVHRGSVVVAARHVHDAHALEGLDEARHGLHVGRARAQAQLVVLVGAPHVELAALVDCRALAAASRAASASVSFSLLLVQPCMARPTYWRRCATRRTRAARWPCPGRPRAGAASAPRTSCAART